MDDREFDAFMDFAADNAPRVRCPFCGAEMAILKGEDLYDCYCGKQFFVWDDNGYKAGCGGDMLNYLYQTGCFENGHLLYDHWAVNELVELGWLEVTHFGRDPFVKINADAPVNTAGNLYLERLEREKCIVGNTIMLFPAWLTHEILRSLEDQNLIEYKFYPHLYNHTDILIRQWAGHWVQDKR